MHNTLVRTYFVKNLINTDSMKKKIYLVLLALQLLTAFGYAAMADDVVRNIRLHKNTVHTRSLTEMPKASIFKDMLSVSFDDSGMYSLYIEDNFGVTVYSSALPANGMEYDYDLSGIGEGLFRLVLSGPSGEYEGYFTIH